VSCLPWRAAATPSALLAAALRRRVSSASGVDLLDLQYLDAAVGPLAELDGHVPRHEGAADAHPVLLPVDQVALQVFAHAMKQHQQDVTSEFSIMRKRGNLLEA
jgi:hypothetical protein